VGSSGPFVISLLHPHHNTKSPGPAQWFDKLTPLEILPFLTGLTIPARGPWGLSLSKDCPSSNPNQIVGGSQTSLGRGLAGAGPDPEAFWGHFLIEMDTLRE